MTSQQVAARLMQIATDVERAGNLVRLGWMATGVLTEEEAEPIAAMLDLVADKLKEVEKEALGAAQEVSGFRPLPAAL